jgi:ligand-binding SRPBCC domain-containing protein
MKPFSFERTQVLPMDLEQAWSFFCDPANLARITPPSMEFRLTSSPRGEIHPGMILTYSLRPLFGIKVDWTTEITHLQKPFFFIDEQRFGPYRFWHHQHHFRQVDDGIEMYDLVHYLLPHMQFTRLVNRCLVAPKLKRIFDFRQRALQEIFPVKGSSGTNPT